MAYDRVGVDISGDDAFRLVPTAMDVGSELSRSLVLVGLRESTSASYSTNFWHIPFVWRGRMLNIASRS